MKAVRSTPNPFERELDAARQLIAQGHSMAAVLAALSEGARAWLEEHEEPQSGGVSDD